MRTPMTVLAFALSISGVAVAAPGTNPPPPNATTCSLARVSAGDCNLVVVAPIRFGAIGSWVEDPAIFPQPSGGRIEPFQRGLTGNGRHTLRFDTRGFLQELQAHCPQMSCDMAFWYGSGSASALLRILVGRDEAGTILFQTTTIDPGADVPTWSQVPAYTVFWQDPTTVARRMRNLKTYDGDPLLWLAPYASGALFQAEQPGWSPVP